MRTLDSPLLDVPRRVRTLCELYLGALPETCAVALSTRQQQTGPAEGLRQAKSALNAADG